MAVQRMDSLSLLATSEIWRDLGSSRCMLDGYGGDLYMGLSADVLSSTSRLAMNLLDINFIHL